MNNLQALELQKWQGGSYCTSPSFRNVGTEVPLVNQDSIYNCYNNYLDYYYNTADKIYDRSTHRFQREKDALNHLTDMSLSKIDYDNRIQVKKREYAAPDMRLEVCVNNLKANMECNQQEDVSKSLDDLRAAAVSKLAFMGNNNPSDEEIRTEMCYAYKNIIKDGDLLKELNGEDLFDKGFAEGVPLFGLYQSKVTAKDNYAKLMGKELSQTDIKRRNLGRWTSSLGISTAAGALTGCCCGGPVGALVGGIVGAVIGVANAIGTAPKNK